MPPNKRTRQVHIEDGTSLGITIFSQESGKPGPVVICRPAMGVPAQYYEPVAESLSGRGFNVVTADLRGVGLSSVRAARGTDFGYHEMVSHDFPAILRTVREEFPGARIYLLGHSLGGQLSCLYSSACSERISGIILIATCSVYFYSYPFPHYLGILVFEQLIMLISRVLGYFPGHVFRFGGQEARGQMIDWARQGVTGRYAPIGNDRDYEALLAEMEIPVLDISFADDGYCPFGPVAHLLDKMTAASKTHIHLSPKDLGEKSVGHFGWVKRFESIAPRINEWIDRQENNGDGTRPAADVCGAGL